MDRFGVESGADASIGGDARLVLSVARLASMNFPNLVIWKVRAGNSGVLYGLPAVIGHTCRPNRLLNSWVSWRVIRVLTSPRLSRIIQRIIRSIYWS